MNLELFYPVKPNNVNQNFGATQNLAYYKANGINFIGHNGIDFQATHGQPVYATHDGSAFFEIDDKQGHGVVIRTNDERVYGGGTAYFKTIYWHLCDAIKEPQFASPITSTDINGPGQQVKAGDLIGYADTTGLSTGDHLHFGLKPVAQGEPAGTWYNIEQNGGYYGAIDPSTYFNGYYAVDAQEVLQNLQTEIKWYTKVVQLLTSFIKSIQK